MPTTTEKNTMTTATKEQNILDRPALVKVTRVFNAPIEKVWSAWGDEDLVKQWWGPEGYTCPFASIDFREGGNNLMAMKDSSGQTIWSGGVYREIIPFKKIVSTDHFADEDGNIISAGQAGMKGKWPTDCLITVEFSKVVTGQVRMAIVHEGIPKDMHHECVEGWNSSLNKLQKMVELH